MAGCGIPHSYCLLLWPAFCLAASCRPWRAHERSGGGKLTTSSSSAKIATAAESTASRPLPPLFSFSVASYKGGEDAGSEEIQLPPAQFIIRGSNGGSKLVEIWRECVCGVWAWDQPGTDLNVQNVHS